MSARHSLLWLVLLQALPAEAQAPPLRLEVAGSCPDAERLRRNLTPWFRLVHEPGQRGWLLSTGGEAGRIRFELRTQEGRQVLMRELESDDCEAAGEAIAIVIQAHFLALSSGAAVGASSVAGSPAAARAPLATRAADRPVGISVALSGGAAVALSPAAAAATGQLDLAIRAWSRAIWVRLGLALSSSTVQSPSSDHVEIQPYLIRLDLAWRLGPGRLWLQPAAGVGVELLRVVALDLDRHPSRLRAHPVAALACAGGLRLSPSLSLRAEVTGQVSLSGDRYVIAPIGEVARSPRVALVTTLGLQFDKLW